MSVHNILVFLWGMFFGYIWSSMFIAALLIKLGYKSIHEIPNNPNNKKY